MCNSSTPEASESAVCVSVLDLCLLSHLSDLQLQVLYKADLEHLRVTSLYMSEAGVSVCV